MSRTSLVHPTYFISGILPLESPFQPASYSYRAANFKGRRRSLINAIFATAKMLADSPADG
jgi:hypothetical protein